MTPTATDLLESPSFAEKRIEEQVEYIVMISDQLSHRKITMARHDELFYSSYEIMCRWQAHLIDLQE